MKKEDNKTRNSSIELLRILAMLMIIGSHYFYHGGFDLNSISFVPNKYIMEFSYLGRLGVCIFVIITGYFMVESHIQLKKIILLYLQVWFYSALIYTLMVLSGQNSFSIKSFIQALLPVSFHQYWFFTAYIVLYLLIPFINSALNFMPSRQRIASIAVMFVMWSVIPTFILTGDLYGSEIPTFILLYCLGAGLRKGDFKMLENKAEGGALQSVLCAALMAASTIILLFVMRWITLPEDFEKWFYSETSVFTIGLAIGLIRIFLNLNLSYNHLINTISSTTFGIYLIHDNRYIRPLLWQGILSGEKYKDSPLLVFHWILSVILVFAVCSLIEFLRKMFIERVLDNKLEHLIFNIKSLPRWGTRT